MILFKYTKNLNHLNVPSVGLRTMEHSIRDYFRLLMLYIDGQQCLRWIMLSFANMTTYPIVNHTIKQFG